MSFAARTFGGVIYQGTLTQGSSSTFVGFDSTTPYGSMSPVITNTGATWIALNYNSSNNSTLLVISGFPSDPTRNYFTQAIVGGVSQTSAAASTYTWVPAVTQAQWVWTGNVFSLASTGTKSALLV